MKIESLYKRLERIVELEIQGECTKPTERQLTEYHGLILDLPIISPLELVEQHRFFDNERDTQLKKTIEEAVQEVKDDFTQKQKEYVEKAMQGLNSEYESRQSEYESRLKAKILEQLRPRCSDDTYSLMESIIERIK